MKVTVRKKNLLNVPAKEQDVHNSPVVPSASAVHVIHVHTKFPVAPAGWLVAHICPTELICSKCGNLCPSEEYRFCPHCGARME